MTGSPAPPRFSGEAFSVLPGFFLWESLQFAHGHLIMEPIPYCVFDWEEYVHERAVTDRGGGPGFHHPGH